MHRHLSPIRSSMPMPNKSLARERHDANSSRMPDAGCASEQRLGDDVLAAFRGCAGEFGETLGGSVLAG